LAGPGEETPASPAVPPQKKSAPESAQSAEVERPKLLANGAERKEEEPLAWCRSVVSAVLHGLFQLCFSRCAPAARPFDASAERVRSALIHSVFRKVFLENFREITLKVFEVRSARSGEDHLRSLIPARRCQRAGGAGRGAFEQRTLARERSRRELDKCPHACGPPQVFVRQNPQRGRHRLDRRVNTHQIIAGIGEIAGQCREPQMGRGGVAQDQ
jgi:hypothetical protein